MSLSTRGLALDIGANKGDWSRELASHFDRVIAVEPDKRNQLDVPDNVETVWGAAWNECGEAVLYKRPSPDQNSLLLSHPIGAGACEEAPVVEKETVPCYTLDAIAADGADFVKIDIEGAEPEVLAACSNDRGQWARTVFVVECHDTFAEVSLHLMRLGKSVTRIPHPSPTAHRGHCWAIGLPT